MASLKKGDRVTVSGYGRTSNWKPLSRFKGTVMGKFRSGNYIVQWDGSWIQDEMELKELKRLRKH